jgi:nitroreductase
MNIKNAIKYATPVVYLRILYSKMLEARTATKYLATAGMRKDANKLYVDLFIRTHALEKGMSIGKVRYGFGKTKAKSLLKDLQLYLNLGGEKAFAIESASIIRKYIEFNKKGEADMSDIVSLLNDFLHKNAMSCTEEGGIYVLSHQDVKAKEKASFDVFSQSRFSVRDFGDIPINREDIEKALKLCERTPSACNRQSQHIHIYLNKADVEKIGKLQMGCNGFYEDMQGAILVCSDMRFYNFQELNQAFVDGGLYAMNLMYALHFYDIANIPLTMAHKENYLNYFKKEMGVPEYERPVLLIGIGSYKDSWKVAQSNRKDWHDYTEWK